MRALYVVSILALLCNGANAQENKIIIKDAIANKTIKGVLDKNDAIFANDKSSFETYRINAKEGQIISLVLNSVQFKPIIEIGDINGSQLCPTCNFSGADGENNAAIKYIVEKDGPVLIRVSNNEAGTFGEYNLKIDVKNAPISTIPKLAIGKTIIGKIDGTEKPNQDGEGFDTYQIKLKKGDKFQADLISKDFEPYLEIIGPEFEGEKFIKTDEGSGEGKNARILINAPIDGTYIFNVYTNNSKGEYSLKLGEPIKYNIPKNQTASINTPILGKLTEQTIDYRYGDKIHAIRYNIKFEAGKKYWISLKSNDFDPRLEIGLSDKDNAFTLIEADDDNGDSENALMLYTANDNLDYIIRATHLLSDENYPLELSETIGNFELNIKEANIAPMAEKGKPIKIGDKIKGEFKDGQMRAWNYFLEDYYEIELKKNQRIEAVLSKPDGSKIIPYISIGEGEVLEEFLSLNDGMYKNDVSNSKVRFKAAKDGKYIIRIQNEDLNNEGEFNLSINAMPDNSKEIAPLKIEFDKEIISTLDLNDMSEGNSDIPYETYIFDAIEGQTYEITQKSDDFDSVFGVKALNDDAPYKLYDDEQGSYYNAQAIFTAPKTGPYLIKASALNGSEMGEFKLKIIKK